MIKLFITGIVLGVAGALALFHFVPVVDQSRETSMISVTPNGGTTETFRINFPSDRILLGAADQDARRPDGIAWPDDELFDSLRGELFKVRNERDVVIGVASRLAQQDGEGAEVVEWVLHLPARGSLYATMDPGGESGLRVGDLRAGTREFDRRIGSLSERYIENSGEGDEAVDGRIELVTNYIAREAGEEDPDGA